MSIKVIGEGTYGCVTKPSITCKNKKNVTYKNKLSKIMRKDHAEEEYDELKSITKSKSLKKYILPLPSICEPKDELLLKNAIKKCSNKKIKNVPTKKLSLLVLDDGGISLKDFLDDKLPNLKSIDVKIFLTNTCSLFEGVGLFNKLGIIHHDIKTRNIVYNTNTSKMSYIDFGIAKNADQMRKECISNTNFMAQTWENFPPEYKYANFEDFESRLFRINYKTFLNRLIDTFDWYSLGIMMKIIYRKMFLYRHISEDLYREISMILDIIGNVDIHKRVFSNKKIINLYKNTLKKYKMLSVSNHSKSLTSVASENTTKTNLSRKDISSLSKVISQRKTRITKKRK